ncbi:DUF6542 domain-containing protein [Streptomyces sp. NPDC020096]
MAVQRVEGTGGSEHLAGDASTPASRGSHHVPGPRERAASEAGHGSRAAARTGRSRTGRTTLLAWGLPVAGAVVDELVGSALGWGLAISAVIAAAVAAASCSRAGTWWVVPAPPLVVAAVTVVAEELAGGAGSHGKGLSTTAVHWAIDAFPAMAAAEVMVIAVLTVRVIRARRSRGKGDA